MKEKANAKVNIFLNVVGRRKDGYHDLNMVTHPIQLHDVLEFELSERDELIGSAFEDDIILKAIHLFKKKFHVKQFVKVTLHKRIPVGAGLGGGSADAAATLRGLNKLFKINAPLEELCQLGVKLGADVPMCVFNKPAVVRGIGESIKFTSSIRGHILLAVPNTSISTKQVFSKTNLIKMQTKSISKMIEAIKSKKLENIQNEMMNDLESITISTSRECEDVKNKLDKFNYNFMMTGSGSVFYNIYNDTNKMMQDIKELDNHGIKWIHTYLGV